AQRGPRSVRRAFPPPPQARPHAGSVVRRDRVARAVVDPAPVRAGGVPAGAPGAGLSRPGPRPGAVAAAHVGRLRQRRAPASFFRAGRVPHGLPVPPPVLGRRVAAGPRSGGHERAAFACPVRETAAFARVDAARGRHRIRMTVHRTSDGFRSAVARDYPFARGRIGLEGRWQFRPRTNHLLSVYGQWLTPVGDQFAAAQEVEVRYSVSPRQRWAWYAGAAWELEAESEPAVTWQAGVRDPRRRLDASLEATASGDGVRWRPRVEGQAPDWRLRFTADSEFPGWRAQWVYTGHPFWEVTAVYKERRQGSGSPGWRSWTYVRLLRRVPGFGEVWMQWNDWDQGRLDVGWSRPVTVAAGISIAF